MHNFLTHILSGHSLSILPGIYEIGCKKKRLHFLSIGLCYGASMHDIEIPGPAQNSMHTMERLVAPWNKSAIFFPKHPAQ